jgi:hypothetical protein
LVAITPAHIICFQLAGSMLKKQYHMLLRTGLRGINPLPPQLPAIPGVFSSPKTASPSPSESKPEHGPLLCVTDDANGAVLIGHHVDHGFQLLGSCRRPHVVNCAVPLELGSRKVGVSP